MAKKEKLSLDAILANINKKAGEDIAHVGLSKTTYTRIPFTSPRMNYCTYGGIPIGRLIEFYGEEHGGKTTTALDVVANFQQMDERKVLYVDVENSLDAEWAMKLGVNVDELILIEPENESSEELFEMTLNLLETGDIGLVIIDSIGAMVSAQELEKSVEDKTYAGISMSLTQFSKKAEMLCKKQNATVIGINQERDDMHAMWAGATKTVGGKSWKYLCSVRMTFRKGSFIDDSGKEINKSSESPAGNIVLMTMTKNKTCPPNRRGGYYTINYTFGIDYLADLIEVAIKYDLIQKTGAWFTIVDPDTGEVKSEKIQGQASVYTYLQDEANEDKLSFIEQYIDSKI